MRNAVNWIEIPATDIDRALKFYGTLLGVEIEKREFDGFPQGFLPTDGQEAAGGAIVQGENYVPGPGGTMPYLNADSTANLDAILGRVEAAGGKVVMPRTSIGEFGFIGQFVDSEGNHIGLHAPA